MMSTERIRLKTPEFYREQKRWYKRLAAEGFHDIEGGVENAHILQQHGGGSNTTTGLNAVQVRSGRPMQKLDTFSRGHEWEELISDQDLNVDARRSFFGTYIHYAQLVTAQEYELQRLGKDRRASATRTAWALHAQGVSERAIARYLGRTRREIRKYLAQLREIILLAIDMDYGS